MQTKRAMQTNRWLTTAALVLSFAAVSLAGCKKEASWKVGDKVDVEWKGSWWEGEVLEVQGDKFKVHYVGWSASWDEVAEAKRLRAPTGTAQKGTEGQKAPEAPKAPEAAAPSAVAWKVGDKVDVEWNGAWWQGEVLEVQGDKYKVHYVGWAASWDEVAEAKRLRAPDGTAKVGTEVK